MWLCMNVISIYFKYKTDIWYIKYVIVIYKSCFNSYFLNLKLQSQHWHTVTLFMLAKYTSSRYRATLHAPLCSPARHFLCLRFAAGKVECNGLIAAFLFTFFLFLPKISFCCVLKQGWWAWWEWTKVVKLRAIKPKHELKDARMFCRAEANCWVSDNH